MQNLNGIKLSSIPENRNLEKFNSFGDGDIYDLLDYKNIYKIDIPCRINILCSFIDRLITDKNFKMRWGKNGNNYPELLRRNEKYFMNDKICYDFAFNIMNYYRKKQQLIKQEPLNKIIDLFVKKNLKEQGIISSIPIRSIPINVTGKIVIGRGNHAVVYANSVNSKIVIKDLKVINKEDEKEIITIKSVIKGISIIEKLAITINLLDHNIIEEKIIFKSDTHIQYIAMRMDGESQTVSKEDFAITKRFALDATKSVLFFNSKSLQYGNFKPCNFLYKKLDNKNYKFYLQDFGGLYLLENNSIIGTNSFHNEAFSLIVRNLHIGQKIKYSSIAQLVKFGNLSGLIFTIIGFHHGCREHLDRAIRDKYRDLELFAKFLSNINIIKNPESIESANLKKLLHDVCYSPHIITEEKLSKIEEILNIWLIMNF